MVRRLVVGPPRPCRSGPRRLARVAVAVEESAGACPGGAAVAASDCGAYFVMNCLALLGIVVPSGHPRTTLARLIASVTATCYVSPGFFVAGALFGLLCLAG